MATQSVPVPAVVAEKLAQSALDSVEELEDKGFTHSAQSVKESAGLVLQQTAFVEGGEFVSLSADVLSDVVTHRSHNPNGSYADCARHFLKQYDVWK
jgi:hypothetical protein